MAPARRVKSVKTAPARQAPRRTFTIAGASGLILPKFGIPLCVSASVAPTSHPLPTVFSVSFCLYRARQRRLRGGDNMNGDENAASTTHHRPAYSHQSRRLLRRLQSFRCRRIEGSHRPPDHLGRGFPRTGRRRTVSLEQLAACPFRALVHVCRVLLYRRLRGTCAVARYLAHSSRQTRGTT